MKNRLVTIILLSFIGFSCSDNKLDVDVSAVELDIAFERFEKEMFAASSPQEMTQINQQLILKGGELYEFYVYDVLRSGSVYDDSVGYYLWYFVTDSIINQVNKDVEEKFNAFETKQERFIDIFKHQKYHLPNAPLPKKIITYNSAFNYGVISTDSVIGIGLEMYLGPENEVIQEIPFPLYVKEKMKEEYLPIDLAHSWLVTNVIGAQKGETFLSSMIYYGKLRYALRALMPDLPENRLIRYTQDEYDFSLASEYNVWQYLIDMDWIYSVDIKVKLRFFEEAPTTVGVEESPGRLGQFIGWRMVEAYMGKNPEVTLEELLREENESKILKAYKPKENG